MNKTNSSITAPALGFRLTMSNDDLGFSSSQHFASIEGALADIARQTKLQPGTAYRYSIAPEPAPDTLNAAVEEVLDNLSTGVRRRLARVSLDREELSVTDFQVAKVAVVVEAAQFDLRTGTTSCILKRDAQILTDLLDR